MGTSQSHELEHCERTVHVPAGVITGKLSGKFKMYLQCSRWVHCWYTVHFLVVYLQCSWWEHHYLPPVYIVSLRRGSRTHGEGGQQPVRPVVDLHQQTQCANGLIAPL